MPSFVGTLMTDISSTTIAFVSEVITNYWLTILGVLFISGMIGFFYHKLGKGLTGGR